MNAYQHVTLNSTHGYSLFQTNEVQGLLVGSHGGPALTQLCVYFPYKEACHGNLKALPTSFLCICIYCIFSHFWTDLNLSAGKMDVFQVLAGRDASVNSLFHIWVFGFSCWG